MTFQTGLDNLFRGLTALHKDAELSKLHPDAELCHRLLEDLREVNFSRTRDLKEQENYYKARLSRQAEEIDKLCRENESLKAELKQEVKRVDDAREFANQYGMAIESKEVQSLIQGILEKLR